ncbi:unnamed protein product [Cuscuta campestris]|nr:unnamed protein product [Cuscuta campestris]
MELSKVLDGFIDADTLIIKAQVQVLRVKPDRPFRCLDRRYRRELVRVYLSNVEQICRRFVEEQRSKLGKLIEDKIRWSGFCAFWLGMDQISRHHMSKEKTDVILKIVVKHFFVDKEVTSTLVMDSLYSGLRALEGHYKGKKGKGKCTDAQEQPAAIVRIEKDMFVLVDDVLLLLERAYMEPLPPKDEKGPQNRTKDGTSGEDFNKESIELDERRLTDLGYRTIEVFVLAQIFSKIEIAYQEAVALKRQEELIREEEAACIAETELKAKRGTSEKEKKSKKKQSKQKRNNRKAKDKMRDEKPGVLWQDKTEEESLSGEGKDNLTEVPENVLEKPDTLEEVSDISDSVDCVPEILNCESGDRDANPVNWDTDTIESHPPVGTSCSSLTGFSSVQNSEAGRRNPSGMDDSSSTCSTDSIPSVVNAHYGCNASDYKNQTPPCSCRITGFECQAALLSSHEQHVKKERQEACTAQERRLNKAVADGHWVHKTSVLSAPKEEESTPHSKSKVLVSAVPCIVKKPSPDIPKQQLADKPAQLVAYPESAVLKTDSSKPLDTQVTKKISIEQVSTVGDGCSTTDQVPPTSQSCLQMPAASRSVSAPIAAGARPTTPLVSHLQTSPHLTRSVSAAGCLAPESPSSTTHGYFPLQSYRNVMMGSHATDCSLGGLSRPHSPSSTTVSHTFSELPTVNSRSVLLPQGQNRAEAISSRLSFSYEMVNRDLSQDGSHWIECSQRDSGRTSTPDDPAIENAHKFDLYMPSTSSTHNLSTRSQTCMSGRQSQGVLADEFPHLDIINDLLDDDLGIGMASGSDPIFQSCFGDASSHHHHLPRHFSFPGNVCMPADPSPASSCRFDRALGYHDNNNGFGHRYPGVLFDNQRDMITQPGAQNFADMQMEGIITSQWQMVSSDGGSFSGMRSADSDIGFPSYSSMPCGVNGYTMFRPSNGF